MTECGLGRGGGSCLLREELSIMLNVLGFPGQTDAIAFLRQKTGCVDEKCVVDRVLKAAKGTSYEMVIEKIRDIAFKVDGPEGANALLDTCVLIRLARQLEANHAGIRFGGLMTIDFMTPPAFKPYGDPHAVIEDFEKNRWKQMHFIFNLDHRMGRGTHWTALVIDVEKGELQYFDSAGRPPPDGRCHGSTIEPGWTDREGYFQAYLGRWMTDVRDHFSSTFSSRDGRRMRVVYNATQHQFASDESNCGVYSILFLTLRTAGESMEAINRARITKKVIEKMRSILYQPTSSYRPIMPDILPERPFAASI